MKLEEVRKIKDLLEKIDIKMGKNHLFFPIEEENKIGLMSKGPVDKGAPGFGLITTNSGNIETAYINKHYGMHDFDFKSYLTNLATFTVREVIEEEEVPFIEENELDVDPGVISGSMTSSTTVSSTGYSNLVYRPTQTSTGMLNTPNIGITYSPWNTSVDSNSKYTHTNYITKEELEILMKLEAKIITSDNIIASFK